MTKVEMANRSGPPAAVLTWPQVTSWRQGRHHLHRRAPGGDILEVAGDVCLLHAQLLSSAELSLWARAALRPGEVERVLWQERSLVKTWAIRGTLHLIPAREYALWQGALSTYTHYLSPTWLRAFGVTRAELDLLLAAIAEALDGRMLTREELANEVARRTGVAKLGQGLRESWGALLKPASFRGLLCFAPPVGQNVRFTRPDGWLPPQSPVDPPAALDAVTRRYLRAYGPASGEDYARWWGHRSPATARQGIARLGEEVVEVEVEGTRAFMLRSDVAEALEARPTGAVRLLPAFDPWVIGASRQADALLAGSFRDRVYRAQGWISPALLVDGRIDGVWKHERRGSRVMVRIEPFVTLPGPAREAAEQEAEHLADFLGARLDLSWGPG